MVDFEVTGIGFWLVVPSIQICNNFANHLRWEVTYQQLWTTILPKPNLANNHLDTSNTYGRI